MHILKHPLFRNLLLWLALSLLLLFHLRDTIHLLRKSHGLKDLLLTYETAPPSSLSLLAQHFSYPWFPLEHIKEIISKKCDIAAQVTFYPHQLETMKKKGRTTWTRIPFRVSCSQSSTILGPFIYDYFSHLSPHFLIKELKIHQDNLGIRLEMVGWIQALQYRKEPLPSPIHLEAITCFKGGKCHVWIEGKSYKMGEHYQDFLIQEIRENAIRLEHIHLKYIVTLFL